MALFFPLVDSVIPSPMEATEPWLLKSPLRLVRVNIHQFPRKGHTTLEDLQISDLDLRGILCNPAYIASQTPQKPSGPGLFSVSHWLIFYF